MTPRHHLSGSRVELAASCLFWARADVTLPASPGNAASNLGSATHEAAATAGESASPGHVSTDTDRTVDEEELADVLRDATVLGTTLEGGDVDLPKLAAKWGLTDSAAVQLAELYDTWCAWWLEWLPEGARVRYEVPFAWNTRTWTARELPSTGPRDYSAAEYDEVTCTLDAVVGCPDGSVIVVDLKTGRRHHPSAATHAQLAVGALVAAHVFGLESVRVCLAKILPGRVYADEATLDVDTLDACALGLQRALAALPSAQPVPGAHCADCYCPLLATCEGPRRAALAAPALAAALPVAVTTEAQAAAVLGSHRAMVAWIENMKRSAREWAERNGGRVTMPDGRVMTLAATTRRTLDVTRAESVLRARFGETMGGLVKLKRSASVTEVERAAAALAPAGRKRADVERRAAMVAAVMSELEATGGVRVSTWTEWREEKPALPEETV